MKSEIQQFVAKTLKELFDLEKKPESILVERPQDTSYGDWSTNIALTLAKELNKSPHEIAEVIVSSQMPSFIREAKVAGPGFINFYLKEENYADNLVEILNKGQEYGNNDKLKGKRIMVEFAHPNPFKSFHIGHLRNIILGESIIRLLESQGAEVIRTNYQGDVGMHIAKCLWAFKNVSPENYPDTADKKVELLGKCYAEGATAFEEDENIKAEIKEINKKIYSGEDEYVNKLWNLGKNWSLEKFHEIYDRVYTTFAREYMESETLKICMEKINKAKEMGILEESEGAVVFKGDKYGIDTRVFLNSEGLPTYEGKELGLAYMEFNDFGNIDLCIHNVAVEQISFFKVTFKVEELMDPGLFKGKQYHNAYEFVGLKSGKMSSRKGQVVLGNDILNEANQKIKEVVEGRGDTDYSEDSIEKIAVGAVKFSFLKISPFTYLSFDLEESINFEGKSGPYIQYTFARTNSLLKKTDGFDPNLVISLNEDEVNIVKLLMQFTEIVEKSTHEYSPHYIASYLYDLCQLYNKFYNKFQIISDPQENQRLMITKAVAIILEKGLDLLGIKTVDRM